jgi:hypothetical protein
MTRHEQKVLHCVNKRNATLSIISNILLYSYRMKSQLQLIQYIFEVPVIWVLFIFGYWKEGLPTKHLKMIGLVRSNSTSRYGVGDFSLLRNVQTGFGVHPVFWKRIVGSLSGDKAARVWGWLSSKRVPMCRMSWAIPPPSHLCRHDVQGQLMVAKYKCLNM